MKRKVLSLMLAAAMTATLFAGCGSKDAGNNGTAGTEATGTEVAGGEEKGSVYYLNFKPEQDEA